VLRLLIADDDADMRDWLRAVLTVHAAVLREAASGWELLEVLSTDGPFDLVITDVRMPAPSGLHVVTMARAAGLATPFLLITAFPQEQIHRMVHTLVDVHLLGKPFSAEQLRLAVRSLVVQSESPHGP
jgi:CheY-like chemotaxis protein